MQGILEGMGETKKTFIWSSISMWLFRVVLCFVITRIITGKLEIAWLCMMADNIFRAVSLNIIFLERNLMKKYIVGVDLDGTLLTSNKEITDRTLWVIEKAVSKGNVIVPVTGRPISDIPKSILECKEIEYAITSNGAVTYNLKENRIYR